MRITLIPFAVLKDHLPGEGFSLELPEGTNATEALDMLASKHPDLAPLLQVTRLAHEDEYVGRRSLLTDGAEYCLIPPVSGG